MTLMTSLPQQSPTGKNKILCFAQKGIEKSTEIYTIYGKLLVKTTKILSLLSVFLSKMTEGI